MIRKATFPAIFQAAICHGSYEISRDSVDFQNQYVFTANFDWALILSGKYRIYISETA